MIRRTAVLVILHCLLLCATARAGEGYREVSVATQGNLSGAEALHYLEFALGRTPVADDHDFIVFSASLYDRQFVSVSLESGFQLPSATLTVEDVYQKALHETLRGGGYMMDGEVLGIYSIRERCLLAFRYIDSCPSALREELLAIESHVRSDGAVPLNRHVLLRHWDEDQAVVGTLAGILGGLGETRQGEVVKVEAPGFALRYPCAVRFGDPSGLLEYVQLPELPEGIPTVPTEPVAAPHPSVANPGNAKTGFVWNGDEDNEFQVFMLPSSSTCVPDTTSDGECPSLLLHRLFCEDKPSSYTLKRTLTPCLVRHPIAMAESSRSALEHAPSSGLVQ